MLEAFITEEEKRPVLHDRTTQSSAVLIAAKRRLRDIEEIPCIQRIVPEIVEHLSVEIIRAGLCCDIDDRAGIASVFGAESRIRRFELVNGVYRWLKRDLLI